MRKPVILLSSYFLFDLQHDLWRHSSALDQEKSAEFRAEHLFTRINLDSACIARRNG